MASYLFACFNQTCKKLISYCVSICSYNNICNCNCGSDNNLITQFCPIDIIPKTLINNLTNTTDYNTNYNYNYITMVVIISIFACFICTCLRTKLAIQLANSNIPTNNNNNNNNNMLQNEEELNPNHQDLPQYNQIDTNPPPNYESIQKNTTSITISDNTSSIV